MATPAIKLEWFGNAQNDAQYLDQWRNRPLSYRRGQATEAAWHRDHYEAVLGVEPSGQLFARASDLLLHYKFYPETLLEAVSDFGQQGRRLRVGDRLVQRIHALPLFGRPMLDVLVMNEISAVIDEPRCQGFSYVTTEGHSECGEWSARVAWLANDTVSLAVEAVSRPVELLIGPQRWFARWLQRRAHHAGIANFKRQLAG